MRHTRWSKLQFPGWSGGVHSQNLQMGNHLFRCWRRMHNLLISNRLRKSKQYWKPLWTDTLHRVLQEHGVCMHGGWHASRWYWETPRIGMMFQNNRTMNGHSTLGWILQFSECWKTHFWKCLSRKQRSIPCLMKMKNQMRRSCTSLNVIKAPCVVHLLLKRRCFFLQCQSSSSFEVVAQKRFCRSLGYFLHVCRDEQWWAHRNAAQIPRFAKSLCVHNFTQSGWDRPQSHRSKLCDNNSEVLGIEWAAPGICMDCPTGAKQSYTHLVIKHWTKWLW